MESEKTSIKELMNGIIDRHLPVVDNISSLLHPDPVKATKTIVSLLDRTLGNFCYYYPLVMITEKTISGPEYTFHDNYKLYAEGKIPRDELELIPTAIGRLGLGGWELTGNYWNYRPPLLQCSDGAYTIKAVYDYPMYLDYTEDGLLTERSHVFGLKRNEMNFFNNILDYTFLLSIKSRSELVALPMSVSFLNLDTIINDLKEQMDEDKQAAATLGFAWT